jgi:hypothetical protein
VHVFVDGQKVAEAASYLGAFQFLFRMYYLLNNFYPKEASLLLEFLQRKMLQIRMEAVRGKKRGPT